MSEKKTFVVDGIMDILNSAKYPITVAQILNELNSRAKAQNVQFSMVKKDINSVLHANKGTKLQIFGEYSPPSWALIGKFKFD